MSASNCVAVGTKTVAGGNTGTLVEAWNGTNWSAVASPNAPGASDNELSSVACRNLLCVAVGSASSELGVATLTERNS
jgi:hypothetical protein